MKLAVPSNIDGLTDQVGRLTKHVKKAISVASAKDEQRLRKCEDAIERFGRIMTSLTEYMGLDVDDLEHFRLKPCMSDTFDIENHGMNVFYPRHREVGLGTMTDNVTICMAASAYNSGAYVQPPLDDDLPKAPMEGDGENATARHDENVGVEELEGPVCAITPDVGIIAPDVIPVPDSGEATALSGNLAPITTPDVAITEPNMISVPDSGEPTVVSDLASTPDLAPIVPSATPPIIPPITLPDTAITDIDISPVPASGEVAVAPILPLVTPPIIPVVNLVHSTPVNSQEAATPTVVQLQPTPPHVSPTLPQPLPLIPTPLPSTSEPQATPPIPDSASGSGNQLPPARTPSPGPSPHPTASPLSSPTQRRKTRKRIPAIEPADGDAVFAGLAVPGWTGVRTRSQSRSPSPSPLAGKRKSEQDDDQGNAPKRRKT